MVSLDDVRRLALALPEVVETEGHFGFAVAAWAKPKGFAWAWRERVEASRPRVPNLSVLAVRVPDLDAKEVLLAADPAVYFTEPHYEGFRAVLVRLDAVGEAELAELLAEAWRSQAPRRLVAAFDAERGW